MRHKIQSLRQESREKEARIKELRFDLTELRFASIGAFAILWAKLEGILDAINNTAFKLGGNAFEKQLPQSLKRKLIFMSRCHKQLPELSGLAHQAEMLIEDVRKLKDKRHTVIHGIADQYRGEDLMKLVRLSYGEEGLKVSVVEFSRHEQRELSAQTLKAFNLAKKHFAAMPSVVSAETAGQ